MLFTIWQALLCFWFGGSLAVTLGSLTMMKYTKVEIPTFELIVGCLIWPLAVYWSVREAKKASAVYKEMLNDMYPGAGAGDQLMREPVLPSPPKRCDPCEMKCQAWEEKFPSVTDCETCRTAFEGWQKACKDLGVDVGPFH